MTKFWTIATRAGRWAEQAVVVIGGMYALYLILTLAFKGLDQAGF